MVRRYAPISVISLLVAGCLGPARLIQPLPRSVAGFADVRSIEITDESDRTVLAGLFSAAATAGEVTTRVATLSGSSKPTTGLARLDSQASSEGVRTETLTIEVSGLPHPYLYRLRIDQKDVAVFSALTRGQFAISLSRSLRPEGSLPSVERNLRRGAPRTVRFMP